MVGFERRETSSWQRSSITSCIALILEVQRAKKRDLKVAMDEKHVSWGMLYRILKGPENKEHFV